MTDKVILGEKYKDPITGFSGIAVMRAVYLYGCVRVALQAKKNKDGTVPDAQYFDEPQLLKVEPKKVKKAHGPRSNPQRIADGGR